MALSNEDKKDVKGAMGKAMANKVSKATRDVKSAKEAHHNSGPYRSAAEAIKSPTFSAAHKAIAKSKALSKKSGERNKFYVGHSNEPRKREVFGSKATPTKESHPYGHVRGPFKSKKEAEGTKDYY